jgi:uncharacterized protein GlcG (DUF336 family)
MSEAQACVSRSIEKAKQLGALVAVAVVDEYGYLMAFARMDGAAILSPDLAVGKAFTASALRKSTAESAEHLKDRIVFVAGLNEVAKGKLVLSGGGLLLQKNGVIVGGIGVSGGAAGGTVAQDEECARAGLL